MFSDPVVGDDFYGRKDVIDLLYKRVVALKSGYRQNIAIIGHQQVGKTSILRHFLHTYNDPQVLSIYVEIRFQALDYFVDQFIRALLYRFLVQKGVEAEATASLDALMRSASPYLPKTLSRIGEISALLRQRQPEEAYSRLFGLTSVVREETGMSCVVILDEFHRLGEFGVRNAFSDFGKRIMVQKDTMYLLASSSYSASRKILAEKLALLFGNFERIYLGHFDFETSDRFVSAKLAPLQCDEGLRNYIVAFTDGHPFFLETIVSRLKEVVLSRGETAVSAAAVAEALRRLLFESQGVLHQYFQKMISPWMRPAAHGSHILILIALSKGRNKVRDIAREVRRGQREVVAALRELMEHELIEKSGVFYRFHNKIFRFWLKEVCERKELSLLGLPGQSEDFLVRVTAQIGEHLELLAMDPAERVYGLLGDFRNDMIELGEKRRKLPHFTEIVRPKRESSVLRGGTAPIVAKGHGRCWVCSVVRGRASEREVLDLVEGSPAGRSAASATRVLVTLDGMDENAKLLAKEKKVLTLGLSHLNLLLDLYGRSPIVRIGAERPDSVGTERVGS
ncbi:MAG: hypothetical protein MOGMAGMI_00899 [Candidatus Omnitrophica bacterium]|nr:hypothetical protein [Candidatus Omnitrophota bacterium]